MRKIKKSFTLLEMMIALVILSMIGTLSVIQIKKLIDAHRFEDEISRLFSALQEAQVLSSAFQTDIRLDVVLENNQRYYQFSTDEPFKTHQFNPSPIPLLQTAKMTFKDVATNRLHVDIYSGRVEPRGILAFYSDNDAKVLWIDMQYGFLLKHSHQKPLVFKQPLPLKPKELNGYLQFNTIREK